MRDSPPSSTRTVHRQSRPSIRRPLTWRGVVASLVPALVVPALVWALAAPVTALVAAAAVVVAATAVRAVARREASDRRPVRATVAQLVRR